MFLESAKLKTRARRGRLRNAEILFYLSEPDVIKWNVADSEFDLIRRYEFFPDISRDNQILFETHIQRHEFADAAE